MRCPLEMARIRPGWKDKTGLALSPSSTWIFPKNISGANCKKTILSQINSDTRAWAVS
jgi:hypothetical protein